VEKIKLAVYSMHPIQYHAPIFRELTKVEELNTTVLYADTLGLMKNYNPEFKTVIKWDVPLLDGYNHQFFKNYARNRISGFFSRINPGMVFHMFTERYDAILIHGYQTFSAWLILFAAKLIGTKVIVRGEAIPKEGPRSWKGKLTMRIARWFLGWSDAVMYSCTGNREYWKELGVSEEKMFAIPCAVDNRFFRQERGRHLPNREEMRRELGIGPEDFVVLFSARFTTRKRPLDLIEAVGKIDHKKIVLLFVGEGQEREAMKTTAKKHGVRTVFTGFVNQAELPRYYTLADMFAVISSYDASPKALNEALNFAIPAITSDRVGTARDLVKEGENGFVVRVGDLEAIADAVSQLNRNREQARKMGERSATIIADWSLENDAKGVLEATRYVLQDSTG
jgi:glycosyltransferase involved in cell wall biosynthesis